MQNIVVVQAVVDGVQAVAVLKGELVTILTDLAGPFAEVGAGRWDGRQLQCSAWLGRDEEHGAMVHSAIEKALAARAVSSRSSKNLALFADPGPLGASASLKTP
ncbi:MAG TPA: hypothetical protein VN894_12185 [Polyangiaceae bacterium]|nr:hypothetical protein [Polyangiaceae bacterium]